MELPEANSSKQSDGTDFSIAFTRQEVGRFLKDVSRKWERGNQGGAGRRKQKTIEPDITRKAELTGRQTNPNVREHKNELSFKRNILFGKK